MRASTASAAALAFGSLAAAAPQNPAVDRRDTWGDAVSNLKNYWGFGSGDSSSRSYSSTTTVVIDVTTTVWEGGAPTDASETTISMHSTVTSVVTVPYPTTTAADVSESSASVASPASPSAAPATATTVPQKFKVDSISTRQDVIGDTVTGGEATYYGGNVAGGTCSFTDYTIPSGLYGTAFSLPSWDAAANCGACVRITGPSGNKITAMIVDACGSCASSHLDLFPDAFSALADPSRGIIPIDYTWVKCGIETPIILHNKDGVSPYWFSMQVVNSNEPVTSLEVSTDGGNTWQATSRQDYNFFQKSSGFGTTTVDVRVTAQSGKTITMNNVKVASDARTTGTSNF